MPRSSRSSLPAGSSKAPPVRLIREKHRVRKSFLRRIAGKIRRHAGAYGFFLALLLFVCFLLVTAFEAVGDFLASFVGL